MTVAKVLSSGFVNRGTEIIIRAGDGFHVVVKGFITDDQIRQHAMDEVEIFSWQDDNKVFIDLL